MNSSFLVIKIDNSCDGKPVEENEFLQNYKNFERGTWYWFKERGEKL